ncbi:MAG TPA: S8 family serine peptidase [Thermoanaerobaculia bacterium]|nr:S8 family serine peptidase [Thermoanaerobaculia bacterium]
MKTILPLLLLTTALIAAEPQPVARSGAERVPRARHFILEPQHVLSGEERAELARRGWEIQKELANGRYLVRIAGAQAGAGDLLVRSLTPLTTAKKLHPSAYAEAARGKPWARLHVVFHDDTSFDEARAVIAERGGVIEDPFAIDFVWPRRIVARVPSGSVIDLASDERVFVVQGAPKLRAETHNATAASMANVHLVQAAPYGLSGQGVVLSYFELGPADTAHPEFGGRLIGHVAPCATGDNDCQGNASHATHVAGTMIASGADARAKGMAPAATLHEYLANEGEWLDQKEKTLPAIGSVADNNSWGYVLGWRQSGSGSVSWTWTGGDEYIGGYDILSATLDKITRKNGVLLVHSSGNSAAVTGPTAAPYSHYHVDDEGETVTTETYCYSENGSGTDCPATCTAGTKFCETVRHPVRSPYQSVGLMASAKNVVAVGAVGSSRTIASFSSRGPTRDGRVKPDFVAKGVGTYSTVPSNQYAPSQGTSMAAPVVTGIAALLTEQWRKSFAGASPNAQILKTLLAAGAQEVGNQGPDYTYGYGIPDAKASADLIIADGGTGRRIRVIDVAQGAQVEFDVTLAAPQDLFRVVLGWADPEVLLFGDELADKTLVNDLDVKVIAPGGATVLPWVLDPKNPAQPATRGVNTVDNMEVVEIVNAPAGSYRIVVTGTRVAASPPQKAVVIANGEIGSGQAACLDPNEPNDSQASAYGYLASGQTVSGRICSATDADFFKVRVSAAGTLRATVAATDTPLRVTLLSASGTLATRDIAAGASATIEATVGAAAGDVFVRIDAAGAVGPNGSYTLTVTYPFATQPRRRSA